MRYQTLRLWGAGAAGAAYLLAALGGAARSMAGQDWLIWGYRFAALLVIGLVAGALYEGGRSLWQRRTELAVGLGATGLLAAPVLLRDVAVSGLFDSLLSFHPAVLGALTATWVAASLFAGGERLHQSRMPVFRSQWQVPLYAALAAYVVVVTGTWLRSLGPEAACNGWLVCSGDLSSLVMAAHGLQRAAALLAGGLLLYTVLMVWRRHQHRPALLVLTGTAVILFATEVVLGADAARELLSPAGSAAHLGGAAALIGVLVAVAAVGRVAPSLPAIAGGSDAAVLPAVRPLGEVVRDYVALTKPRILLLLLITGYAAMWVAAGGLPNPALSVAAMIGLAMSCGAANAINMWYDRDIDQVMHRTQKRPIPAGRLTPAQALAFGVLTGALSFVLLALTVNLLSAVLSLAGLLFYVGIYTMWLKRSTTQNIVIGGAAGAVPPLVGWAAVTGDLSWAAWVMFLIVFVWTPPHFWALALFRNEDYRRAGVPMLPVVRGERHTKWQILLYAVTMVPATAALYWTGVVGEVYLWFTTALGLSMVGAAVMLFVEKLPAQKWAVRTFVWSILWLGLVFAAMVLDLRR